ncbi:MAG: heat-inducible transcriptional repressor HrcA [Lysobacterales bacterium]
MSNPLDPRASKLLHDLIEHYIRAGEPVGSATLARECGLDLSPATVRNVLAQLEEQGLITAPHASAGRVPTTQGFRLFVDALVHLEPVPEALQQRIGQALASCGDPRDALRRAADLLSGLTRCVSLVRMPRREDQALAQVDFLPLGQQRVLVVLVFRDGEVQNRIARTDREYSLRELSRSARALNRQIAGLTLAEVRQRILGDLKATRSAIDQAMTAVVGAAESLLEDSDQGVVMAGERTVLEHSDLDDLGHVRALFQTFDEKRSLLHLLERSTAAERVRLFIGEESGLNALGPCSVITAPYRVGGQIGVLGVIGPRRMPYQRVIPIVETTARALSQALA